MDKRKILFDILLSVIGISALVFATPLALSVVAVPFYGTELLFGFFRALFVSQDLLECMNEQMSLLTGLESFIPMLGIWMAIILAVIIRSVVSIMNPSSDRSVKDGVFGKQEVVSSKSDILLNTEHWNGKGKAPRGVAVGSVFGRSIIFDCNHAIICAPSGCGKTREGCYPTIDALSSGGENNLIITDPSLEIFVMTRRCLEKRGYETLLIDFDNPMQGLRFNPLKLITDLHKSGQQALAEDRAREIGSTLFPAHGNENDVFINAAGGAFAAVSYYVAASEDVPDKQRNLASVIKIINAGTMSGTAPLKDWLRSFGEDSPQIALSATFLASESKMESSILGSIHDGLQPFNSSSMRWLTSESDIDIDDVITRQSAVFLHIVGPGNPNNKLASLFLAQHWAEVQRLGKRRGLRPCWVVGDEFHSLPKFTLVHALEQARKYGLHYVMYVQSLSGLDSYKTSTEDGKDAILANCDLKVLYKAGSEKDAKQFEIYGGYKTIKSQNKSRQSNASGKGTSESYSEQKRELWPADEILNRDPRTDGVLVFSQNTKMKRKRKFEIPIKEVSKTFSADHFGTLGTPDYERSILERTFDELEEKARVTSIEVVGWCPNFESTKSTETIASEIAYDEISAGEVW